VGKFIPVEPEKWAEMVKAQAEVARLKAEVERLNNESDILQKCCEHQKNRIERLKAEVEHLLIFCNCTLIPSKELQAKVERLTKAGDAMADRLMYQGYPETVPAWNDAKKGVQS
jgi:predicted RNase H-like nuclease (RuvC/YqgF family)